jgi:hypothetical protein
MALVTKSTDNLVVVINLHPVGVTLVVGAVALGHVPTLDFHQLVVVRFKEVLVVVLVVLLTPRQHHLLVVREVQMQVNEGEGPLVVLCQQVALAMVIMALPVQGVKAVEVAVRAVQLLASAVLAAQEDFLQEVAAAGLPQTVIIPVLVVLVATVLYVFTLGREMT